MIQVKNLTKTYGKNTVVDHLDFQIKKGQICGFLGPNGAGKSTTMNMITGYIAMTEGEVSINGYDIFEEPEQAKTSIGYLPEIPPVYMDMTPSEYLKFVAELKKIERVKQKVMMEDVMEMTRITHMKDRLIKNLSKGYRQRVGLAQALMGYPEVLILDEPTVGLDPKQIIQMRQLIRELGKSHTIILSSHILSEISEVCDHVMILSNGKLVADDSLEHLQRQCEGQQFVHMTVRGDGSAVSGIVRNMQEIRNFKMTDSVMDTGAVDLFLELSQQADDAKVREQLFRACVDAGCVMLMMRTDSRTLEQIFLELTQPPELEFEEEPQKEQADEQKKDKKQAGNRQKGGK